MELGLYTFAEMTPDPATGETPNPAQRLRDLLEEVELADRLGLDVFGVGDTTGRSSRSRRRRWC
jgi:hypothetical protein